MKLTLSVEEYLDGSPIARAGIDEWLEKHGLLESGIVDIRIVRIFPNGKGIVSVWFYERESNGRIQRTATGKPVIGVQNFDKCELPPLDFFYEAVA